RPMREDNSGDLVGDRAEGVARRDDVRRPREQFAVRGRHAAGFGRRLKRLLRLCHQRLSPSVAVVGGSSSTLGLRTSARYDVRGRLFSSSSRVALRGLDFSFDTWLPASLMSPNTIALVGQAAWHAVRISPSRIL